MYYLMHYSVVLGATALAGVLLIWIGYPVAVWLLASVADKQMVPNRIASEARSVSVILATRDEVDSVLARVANLYDTAHPMELLEVVVALDAQGSKTTPAMLTASGLRAQTVVGDAPGGKASTLNAGVRVAKGDILVLTDVAQRFDSRTIPELVAALEDKRFGAVSGALELPDSERRSPVSWYWRMEKWLRYNESRVHSSVGVTGAVYAIRRELWPELPPGTLLDDVYVPMSVVLKGRRVGFTYHARARDVRSFGSNAEGIRKSRTMTGVMQLVSLLPETVSTANPIVVQFVLHKLARLTTPLWLLVFAMAAVGAFAAIAIRYPSEVLIGAGVIGAVIALSPSLRRRLVHICRWAFAMQVATIRAVSNGVRGNWAVWNDPPR